MKSLILPFLATLCLSAMAQSPFKTENIFIITMDGVRWQEVFTGADPFLINSTKSVEDTGMLKAMYWAETPEARRRQLFPFFWSVIEKEGLLYGNRHFDNKVNVKNLYKISYPGYNEMFTGFTDPSIIINFPKQNPNVNILEYLNTQPAFSKQVVAFSSWYVFPRILNADRSGVPVNSGYNGSLEKDGLPDGDLIDSVQNGTTDKSHTRHDWLTYLAAREYIFTKHPRVAFIGLGETDEYAHHFRYDMYLQKANAIDKIIAELWYAVQTDPHYRNKTTFIITTDHGRGNTPVTWFTHSFLTAGSGQTWMAILGPDVQPLGEMKMRQQLYLKQVSYTVAMLLGEQFKTAHKPMPPIALPLTAAAASSSSLAGH